MATSTYELIVKAVDQTGGSLNRIDKNLQKTNKSAGRLKMGIAAIGAALATLGTGQAIRNIVGVTATFQDLKVTLGSVLGDINKGNKAFEAITNLSTKTQFGVEELSSTFIRLAAAGIQPTNKLFKTFTDAAAVTTDQVGVLNAMTEVFTRTTQSGVVELMEFDKLADRGLPVYDILKQKLGVTRNELNEFSKEVGGAAKVLQALEEGINERFGGATENRLKNLSVAQSNFSIELRKAANTIGEQFAPALTDALDKLTAFIGTQKPLLEAIGTGLKKAIEGASAGLSILAENIDVIRNVLLVAFAGPAIKAILAVGNAFLAIATPIRLLKALILGGVAALTFFQDTTVNLNDTTVSFGEIFKAVFGLIGDSIKNFANFMGETFTNIRNFVMEKVEDFQFPFADTFEKIGGIVKGALNFIINSFQASFENIRLIVFSLPDFFVGVFDGVVAVAQQFGSNLVARFRNIFEALKLLADFEFKAALTKVSEQAGASVAEAFDRGFANRGIETLSPERVKEIFGQDRVGDAVEFIVTKSGELATFIEGKLTPVYGELQDAILKKIEANRAELKTIEDTNKANLETAQTLDEITIPKTEEAGDKAIETSEKVKTLAEQINESITENGKSFSQSLARNLAQGKASLSDFSSFVNKVLEDIAAMIIQKRITDPLIEGILGPLSGGSSPGGGIGGILGGLIGSAGRGTPAAGGFSFGNIFSSIGSFFGLANGGIARGGQAYMVGERGPEMFIPNTTGQVVSNEQMGPGRETIVNFNINAIDTQTGMEFLLKNKPQIIGMVSQAHNQRGRAGITG